MMFRVIRVLIFWLFLLVAFFITWLVVYFDRLLKPKFSFPRDISDLKHKKPWFIECLKQANAIEPNAIISNYEVKALAHQVIVFRSDTATVSVDYTVNNEPKTLKVIAKFAPTSGTITNKAIYNLQGNHIKELAFYKKLFPRAIKEINAPQAYFGKVSYFTGNTCLLLEFLEDHEEFFEDVGCPEAYLEPAVKAMAKWHAAFWNKEPHIPEIITIPPIVTDVFESFTWGKWHKTTRSIFQTIWSESNVFQTVIHGDLRVGNIMFSKSKPVKPLFIDWQAVRKGKGAFDLAYFIVMSVKTTLRKAKEDTLKQLYYQTLVKHGVKNYSIPAFEKDYNYAVLMVLSMLALPYLSGEGSAEGKSLEYFRAGHAIWFERIRKKTLEFNSAWFSSMLKVSEIEFKQAVKQMLQAYKTQHPNLEAYINDNLE